MRQPGYFPVQGDQGYMDDRTQTAPPNTTAHLAEELKRVAEDAESLLNAGTTELAQKTEALQSRLAHALELARTACEALQSKTVAGARATDRAIRKNPYPALGIAFGVGVCLALFLKRNKD